MKNINEIQNSLNSDVKLLKLNLDDNSNEFLNKYKSSSPHKKMINKSMITSNFSIKDSNSKLPEYFSKNSFNRNFKSGTIYFPQNNDIINLINNSINKQEIRKSESINLLTFQG